MSPVYENAIRTQSVCKSIPQEIQLYNQVPYTHSILNISLHNCTNKYFIYCWNPQQSIYINSDTSIYCNKCQIGTNSTISSPCSTLHLQNLPQNTTRTSPASPTNATTQTTPQSALKAWTTLTALSGGTSSITKKKPLLATESFCMSNWSRGVVWRRKKNQRPRRGTWKVCWLPEIVEESQTDMCDS